MRLGVKLLLVAVAVVAAGVTIGLYVSNLTTFAGSPSYSVPVWDRERPSGRQPEDPDGRCRRAEAQSEPRLGLVPDPGLERPMEARDGLGPPANAIVHVTIYNFDGASGLRNPYLARPQGMVGNRCSSTASP